MYEFYFIFSHEGPRPSVPRTAVMNADFLWVSKKKWAQLLSYPPCLNKVWSMKSFHVDTMWRHINWFPLFYYLLLNCIMNSRLIWYVDIFSSCFVVVFHEWWNKWKKNPQFNLSNNFSSPFFISSLFISSSVVLLMSKLFFRSFYQA